MKEAIKGYITALINTRSKSIQPWHHADVRIAKAEALKDLHDLLGFVEDIPSDTENDVLKKRVKELEQTCEDFIEIEKNQLEKIIRLSMELQAEITAREIFGGAANE